MDTTGVAQITFVILVISILSGAAYLQFFNDTEELVSYPDYGIRPDFTLPSVDGDNFTFSEAADKIRLVTFIYTKCQQGCATVSANMANVMDHLEDKGLTDAVQFVTIDFDWQFDTMDNLTHYAGLFRDAGQPWEFLLGNQNQTETVTDDWGFWYNLTKYPDMHMPMLTFDQDHSGHEVVYDHTFIVYIVDQEGHWRHNLLGLDWTTQDAMRAINYLLE